MTEDRIEAKQDEGVVPVTSRERIHAVDVVRGFAVFGILTVNMYGFAGLFLNPQSESDLLDRSVIILIMFFAQAKFYSMFSMLFGWGLFIQMERALAKGIRFIPLYLRRTAILLLIGVLHGIFLWSGDILTVYAVLATLLLIFRNRSMRLLVPGVFLLLTLPIVMNLPGQFMEDVRQGYEQLTEFMRPSEQFTQAIFGNGSYWEISQRRF